MAIRIYLVIGSFGFLRSMDPATIVLFGCVGVFTALGAILDVRTKKLPNILVVPAFVLALLFHAVRGAFESGLSGAGGGILFALAGFGTGFGVLFVVWLIGGGGGGDVKFMGAVGAWLGWWLTFQVLIVSVVFVALGAVLVLLVESFRLGVFGVKRRYLSPAQATDKRLSKEGQEQARQAQGARRRLMPFGVPVALATWCVLAFSEFILRN